MILSWAVLGRFIGGGANVVTAQYLRKVVPGRVTLAAEYQAQIGAGSQVSCRLAQAAFGMFLASDLTDKVMVQLKQDACHGEEVNLRFFSLQVSWLEELYKPPPTKN